MIDTFAIYDERGVKYRGGFATAAAALIWYMKHPMYDLYDADGEWVAEGASEYELRLSAPGTEGGTLKARADTRFDYLVEVM